jgi:dihydroneopterin aldolase
MSNTDTIEIRRLKVETHIGVPAEERAAAQPLWITVLMTPSQGFSGLGDDISRTIDYHAVAVRIRTLAASKTRRLIETLAVEIADDLMLCHPLSAVRICVEKQILPDTDFVAVRIERHR